MKYRNLTILMLLALLLASSIPLTAQDDPSCEDGIMIAHDLGETCVPNTVERVVTIEHSMTETVVTLGVQPVGVTDLALYNDLVQVPAEGAVDVGSRQEPNLEAIAGLDPDLIVAASWRISDVYEELSAIAPTITFEGSTDLATLEDYFTTVATALGREAEAQQILADTHQHFDEAAEIIANAEIDPRFVLSLSWYADNLATFRLYTDNTFPVEILEQLGLENTWDGAPNPNGFDVVGIESLGDITDTNFLYITDAESAPFYAESPLWNSLPVVQAETAYRLSDSLWLYGGPISAQRFVDAVLDALGLASGYPMTIEHEVGTTTIEAVPERIVVLEYSFADHLGTLGIAPVGYAVDAPPEYIYAYTADVGAVDVGTRAEPSLEAILELAPDLIIADLRRHEAIYDQLSLIAPTVVFNSLRGSYEDQLEQFSTIAEIMGKEDEATAILASYEEDFEAALATTDTTAGEFVIGVLHSGGFTAHSDESFMGSFLESLGRTNALQPEGGETQYLLDMEGFAVVNPSTIVILCSPEDQPYLDDMTASPLWQAFDAVTNNRVYTFDRNLWSKGRGVTAYVMILADAVDSGLLANTESQSAVCGGEG